MDINFPLILLVLVCVSGFIYLLDVLVLASSRAKKAAANGVKSTANEPLKEPLYVEYSKSFFPVLLVVFILRSFIVEPFQIPSESMVPTLEVGDFILVNKFTYGLRLPVVRNKVVDINQPKRGDVMVFFPPKEKRYFIKRVVGLPGDKIDYIDNELFVNGKKIKETLLTTGIADKTVGESNDHAKYIGGQLYVNGQRIAGALAETRSHPYYQLYSEGLGDGEHLTRKLLNPGYHGRNISSYIVPKGHYFMMGDNRNNSSDSRIWGPVPEENIVGKAFAIWMHWKKLLSLPSFSRVGGIE